LYQDLVVTGLAAEAEAWLDANEYASVLAVEVVVASGVPVEKVERALEASVARLAQDGPTKAELARAKKGVVVELSSSLQLLNGGMGDGGRAGMLQQLNHYLGDPGRLPAEMQKLVNVDAAELQRRVRDHLGSQQRVTVVTVPKAPSASPPESAKPASAKATEGKKP
jgi:predicted Zn-dependent peptidase